METYIIIAQLGTGLLELQIDEDLQWSLLYSITHLASLSNGDHDLNFGGEAREVTISRVNPVTRDRISEPESRLPVANRISR